MIHFQDMMSDLIRFPEIKEHLVGAKYTGGVPMIYRFTGVENEHPFRLDLNKYRFTTEVGPEEVDRKSGMLDMVLYPEEIAYAESGYPCGEKFVNDNLFGILISKNGTSCDDNGYYDNLDAYICTLGDDWMPTYEQWFDIANRYLAPYYIPDTQANVCLMSSMNRYDKIPMKRGYEIATIDRLMQTGAIPLFWFAIDDERITLYMADSEKALDRIF